MQIADEAGILWTDDRPHPDAEIHTGSADREREIRRQASYHNNNNNNNNNYHNSTQNSQYSASAPPVAHATAASEDNHSTNQSLVYRADGTIAR